MRISLISRLPLRRVWAAGAALFLSLLSCGREVTGPADGIRIATGLSFVAEFPPHLSNLEQGAGDLIPFTRVRIFFRRSDNSIALDQTYPFGGTVDSLPLALNITLSPNAPAEGEPLSLFLRYMNTNGDTVFSGGPVQVLAVARRRGDPLPPPAQVPLKYTGPGAQATTVQLSPDTLSIVAGDAFAFTATARDSAGAIVEGAPIRYVALDTDKAPLATNTAAAGTALATRGIARVRATLQSNGAFDEAILNIAPKPASLTRVGTAALAGITNTVLGDSIAVQLNATDGGTIANAAITVTIEGGGSVNDSTLITDANGRAAVQWTLGGTVGVAAQRLRFNSTGVTEASVTANVTAPVLPASRLVITQEPASPVVSLAPMTPVLTVEARDSTNTLVATHTGTVQVSVASGPGFVGEVTSRSFVAGVATFTGLGADKAGTYRLAVTSSGLTPDTTAAFNVVAGPAQNIVLVTGGGQTALVSTLLPGTISVRVTDGATNPVSGATVTFAVATGGGSLLGATTTTDSLGVATLGGWTLGATAGTQSITATVGALSPLTITATAQPLAPVIQLNVVGSNVVGFQREGELRVKLLQPAPAGGLTVSVISDSTAYLTIAAPGSVNIPAGDTTATIGVTGVALGTAVVRATGTGYTPDTLAVPVSLNLISLPTSLNVSLAGTTSLPVSISAPAPAGGVVVRLTTANAATARTTADSVVIASGTLSANATLEGVSIGTTTISATNPNYAPDVVTVGVTAAIDITNANLQLNQSFGAPMTVRLASGGVAVAAPPGGILVNLEAVNPSCAVVPSTALIGAGFTNVIVNVTAGVGPTFPCNTLIRATGPAGFTTDSVTATVAATPGINSNNEILGAGLQTGGNFTLGATNHGGTVVRVTSTEPDRILLAPNNTTLGTAFLDVNMTPGSNLGSFVIQALETVPEDTVALITSAPGFTPDTFTVVVTKPVHSLLGLAASRTTGQADNVFTLRVGTPSSPTNAFISTFDIVRFGGPAFVFNVVNDSTTRGELVTAALTGDSVTVSIAPGSSSTSGSVALGGVAFRSEGAGTTVVRMSSTFSRPSATSSATVTTVQSSITQMAGFDTNIGVSRGLQRTVNVQLSEARPAGDSLPVTVRASRPGFVVLSNNQAIAGTSDSLVTWVPGGASIAPLSIQLLENAPLDTFSLIATAPGYTTRREQTRPTTPIIRIFTDILSSGTVGNADDEFRIEIGSSDAFGTGFGAQDVVRAGSPGFFVSAISDSTQYGTLVTQSGTADSVRFQIAPGTRVTPGTVALGGVAFRYLAAGTAVVRVSSPSATPIANSTRSITISQPSISGLTAMNIGAGLMRQGTVTLNTLAPAGGLQVVLRADTPNTVQFAPNISLPATDSLVVTIAANTISTSFVLHALDVAPDTINISASAPGWVERTAIVRVWQPVIDFLSVATSMTTLSADDIFNVRIGSPSTPTGTFLSSVDPRRFGAPPLPITIRSSNGFVGRLVTSSTVSDSVVISLLAGQSNTAGTVALGGVGFRALTSGTTVLSATAPNTVQATGTVGTTVTVATPGISITTAGNVGSGLQTTANFSLAASLHGGVQVILKSSNPGVLKLSRFATDEPTDSIIVALNDGSNGAPFVISGMENVTGQVTITARAPGFIDGSALATVVQPAVEIQFLTATQTAGAAESQFRARVGLPNVTLVSVGTPQALRIGGPGLTVTATSSNTAVGTLVTTALTGSPVTVNIAPGQAASPSLISSGGVGFKPLSAGTSTVTVSAPNYLTATTTGNVTVTVNAP